MPTQSRVSSRFRCPCCCARYRQPGQDFCGSCRALQADLERMDGEIVQHLVARQDAETLRVLYDLVLTGRRSA